MSLQRARIIKGTVGPNARGNDVAAGAGMAHERSPVAASAALRGRRIASEVLEARAEGARIIARAKAEADAVAASAAHLAARDAREQEVARLAAGFLALRAAEEDRAAHDLDRVIELAVLLAERLIGVTLQVEPARIGELAAAAIHEARGARRIRIDASPEDVVPLTEALGAIGQVAEVQSDSSLHRGSLVVHTDLGRVDARLEPQLTRLATALREALK